MALKTKCGGVLLVVFGALLCYAGFVDWRRHEEFLSLSIETKGVITGYDRQGRWDSESKRKEYIDVAIVRYSTVDTIDREDRSLPRDPAQFPVGTFVTLRYRASEPATVEYSDSSSYVLVPFLLGFLGLASIGSGWMVFRMR